jgi:hypothetical protein
MCCAIRRQHGGGHERIDQLCATGGAPVAIIAAVRNNSATTSWLLHANLAGTVGAGSTPDV